MRALVTGATGFVGAAVARALLGAGWQVRTLVRGTSNRRNLVGLNVEIAVGDLKDLESLQAAMTGCTAVFHVAADYRLGAPKPDELYRNNVDGTRNILAAAARAGVRRLVYTSSVATIGLPRDGSPGDESTPVMLADMIGHYKRSKFLAEAVVRDAPPGGVAVIIVNPSTPVGPGDIKPTPTGQLVLDAAAGRTPAYVDTGLNIVHVDDVAAGHLLAFHHGKAGERYILGGEDMCWGKPRASRSKPSACRKSACSSPAPRRQRTWVIAGGRRSRRSPTPSTGFVNAGCCAEVPPAMLLSSSH